MTDNAQTAGEATGSATQTPAAFDWGQHLQGEELGYIQNKRFADPAILAKSYRELESMRGIPAERILAVPEAGAAPEAWDGIYNRLGRPETPDKYDFKFPEGFTPDDGMLGWFKGVAHKAGMNQAQAAQFVEQWNTFSSGQSTAMQERMKEENTAQFLALKESMGAKQFEERFSAASSMLEKMGFKDEDLGQFQQVLGVPRTAQLFMKMVDMVSEDRGSPSNANGSPAGDFTMTKDQAQAAHRDLMTQLSSDSARMAQYITKKGFDYEKMERLQRILVDD